MELWKEMVAKILWWNEAKTQGIAQIVGEDGVVSKYFLLGSQIVQRPAVIKPGYYAKFRDALQPRRPDLLPVAVGVVVLEYAPTEVNVGANALAGGV
jgi:hypothetical protein